MEKFRELGLEGEILKGIADLGFETPSPVQEKVIPVILGEERDLVALAQTGTGKTAAFGLPLLQKLDGGLNKIQVLILSPTRELCVQIGNDLKNYSKYRSDLKITSVYGGTDIRRQIRELEKGVHVLVATPGRLCDLINRDAVDIEAVRAVVLDESDEMLNMGFKEDLNFILEATPKERNTYLFSATMPREVERIARNYLHDPMEIAVGKKNQGADTVSHQYYQVRAKDCYETLHRVIDCAPDMYAIIFTRTKIDAREIAHKLQKDSIDCDALHGDLSQTQRDEVMARFRSKRLKVLVATDVAARGLDVDNLTHVINYNLPEDVESYTHRSGRTGRAGREGISVAIINSKEKGKLKRIEHALKKQFEYREVPGGEAVCRAQLLWYADKILASEQKETLSPYQQELFEKFGELTKEELIQKIVSYEFGRLLKKYAAVEDLNLSESERYGSGGGRESGRDGKKRGGRESSFTVFNVNVGRDDDFTPRDLMTIINEYAPVRGLEIGGIRIFNTNTKFEVDVTGIERFGSYFRNVNFNGLPFTLTETGERPGGLRKPEKGGERGGKWNATAKWKNERRFGEGNSRGRFGEKRKGMDNGRRSAKKK
ncbi:MAG: DEAD/DEAH box helicase [Culturomica sp.]|jgi:ATP-dependent RNA helicase DeaD|nr:DEAD/DEAH box helicase [Culturomica sp.]